MPSLLKILSLFFALGLIACAPVEFSESPSCDGFGEQDCLLNPDGGDGSGSTKRFDNTITIEPAQADILFIDDNSGSMSVEQAKMADRFPTLINILGDIDYRIAITTTDVSTEDNPARKINKNGALQNGKFIRFDNGSKVLTRSMDDVLDLFKKAIKRPETLECENKKFAGDSCPSPDERAIYAANLAVDRSDPAFFRANSHLAIIILSDEDERSEGGALKGFPLQSYDKPQVLIDNVKAKFGEDKSFAVHSVIIKPGDKSCLNKQNNQKGLKGFEGRIYKQLSDLTNGHVGSICASNYGNEMGAIGSAVVEAVNSIELACAPIDDEVSVTVTPEIDGLEFELESDEKRIRFNQSLPAGASVRVVYDCPAD